jgi:hypothetical protein
VCTSSFAADVPPFAATGDQTIAFSEVYPGAGQLGDATSTMTGANNDVTIGMLGQLNMADGFTAVQIGNDSTAADANLFDNLGQIRTSNADAVLVANGTGNWVDNSSFGTITVSGTGSAIHVSSGLGTQVFNFGAISTESGNAIQIDGDCSQSLINDALGSITTQADGINIGGANSNSIYNYGSIDADQSGIVIDDGNSGYVCVRNSDPGTTASIVAGMDGIRLGSDLYVEQYASHNSGTIIVSEGAGIEAGRIAILVLGDNTSTGVITNAGNIEANQIGIYLAGQNDGAIYNEGAMSGGTAAIGIVGDNTGHVSNSGSISDTIIGIIAVGGNSGYINNAETGTIDTGMVGIYFISDEEDDLNRGIVANEGRINSAAYGIFATNSSEGYVGNRSTGVINAGYAAMIVSSNAGTFDNAGTLITMDGPGMIVSGDNTGLVRNTGSIASTNGDGILVSENNDGHIMNRGAIGSETQSVGGRGIAVDGDCGGVIWNTRLEGGTASIHSVDDGIAIGGNLHGLVETEGEIYTQGAGIHVVGGMSGGYTAPESQLTQPARITNSGLIDAIGNGIQIDGNITIEDSRPEIINSGTILSNTADGIHIGGDSVCNITNEGYIGTSSQMGTPTFTGDNGIQVVGTNTGMIINGEGAVIHSIGDGILIGETFLEGIGEDPDREAVLSNNGGEVVNSGTIVSQGGNGISIMGDTVRYDDDTPLPVGAIGGIAYLAQTINVGQITSLLDGIHIGGDNNGYTRNLGTITSTDGNGIYVGGDNSGLLANDVTIDASDNGILVVGSNIGYAHIVNSGTITAEHRHGIELEGNNEGFIENGNMEQSDCTINAEEGIRVVGSNSGHISNYAIINTRYEGIRVGGANSGSILNAAGASIISERSTGITVGGYDNGGNSGDIMNEGAIVTRYDGISVSGGNSGNIVNATTGTIDTRFPGISVLYSDNTGTVKNLGSIRSETLGGIYLSDNNSGSIQNEGTGVIVVENGSGILVEGSNTKDGIISNLGTITAGTTSIAGNGITVSGDNAGMIVNGPVLSEAISIVAEETPIENNPTDIIASNDGILVGGDNTGFILNYGDITAGGSGIRVNGNSLGIQNFGRITSVSAGISISGDSEAVVTIGTITTTGGVANGIEIWGNAEAIISISDITSTSHGIFVEGNVSGDLLVAGETNAGTESEAACGLYVTGSADSILANGDITATDKGIFAGSVTSHISTTGSITSTSDGIHIENDVGGLIQMETTINSGAIGVNIGGSVGATQDEGGLFNFGDITGVTGGVSIHGDSMGEFINAGSITATGEMGEGFTIYGDVDGVIINDGTISAGVVGIGIDGDVDGEIVNNGTINCTNGGGIQVVGNVGLITNTGTITSGWGITAMGGEGCTIINSGTITSTHDYAMGIGSVIGAEIVNTGSISVSGTSAVGIYMLDDGQVFANAGSLASNDIAVKSSGASTVYMGVYEDEDGVGIASVEGDMISLDPASRIVFGMDLASMREDGGLVGNDLFVMNYDDEITNFEAEFLAGTTNFGGDGENNLNSSIIRAGASLNVNNTTVFTGTDDSEALVIEGHLGGTGSVILMNEDGSLGTMVNNGVYAPGNSIGSSVISGNFNANGIVEIEVAPTAGGVGTPGVDNDHITVTSPVQGQTATLVFGSSASISFIGDTASAEFLPGSTYNIITLQDATLQVSGASSTYSLIAHTDNLDDYSFYVVGDASTTSAVKNVYAIAARDHDYEIFGKTPNQKSVGAYLSNYRGSSTLSTIRFGLETTAGNENLNRALDLASGEIYPSMVSVEASRVSALVGKVALMARPSPTPAASAEQSASKGWRTFAQTDTIGGDAKDGLVSDIDFENYGVLAGAGKAFGNGMRSAALSA